MHTKITPTIAMAMIMSLLHGTANAGNSASNPSPQTPSKSRILSCIKAGATVSAELASARASNSL